MVQTSLSEMLIPAELVTKDDFSMKLISPFLHLNVHSQHSTNENSTNEIHEHMINIQPMKLLPTIT
jgi:hypothetical protein